MSTPSEQDSPTKPPVIQAALAVAIVAWRVCSPRSRPVYADFLLIAAVYWIFILFGRNTRAWWPVTLLVMLGLFGLHVWGILPACVEFLLHAL